MIDELFDTSLIALTARLRERRLSPVELMETVLGRIEADPLNAVVAVLDREQALGLARDAEQRIARGEAGPLEGVPLGVKDLENVAGMVTTFGSALYRDHVARRDDVHVARLRAAGAIPMAKTNAPEFGPTPITKNLLHGVTRSPWDLDRSPGGSSGGSAAALAGGILPLVTASDGGGSIRIPASWSGTFGLKPSHGRVPIAPTPAWDTGQMSVYGPLTRTVEDAALILDLYCGPTPLDPIALPAPGYAYRDKLREPLSPGLRIGLSPDFGRILVQGEVARAVEEGARVFEKAGHRLVPVAGGPPPTGEAWDTVAGFGLAGRLADLLPGREQEIQRSVLRLIERGREFTPALAREINEQRAAVRDWCAGVFDACDLLITPTTPYTAPPARSLPSETDGKPQDPLAAGAFTQPFNMAWQPAASLRAGLTRDGLPIGLQIVGPHHRDDLVLQACWLFERERPWNDVWPMTV